MAGTIIHARVSCGVLVVTVRVVSARNAPRRVRIYPAHLGGVGLEHVLDERLLDGQQLGELAGYLSVKH